jgi:hypothetical protein
MEDMKYLNVFIIIFVLFVEVDAQRKIDRGVLLDPGFLFGLDYGYNFAGGDLKDRFGNNLKVEANLSYIFKESGFAAGIRANYFFGDTVYQDVLAHLRDQNGHILGINGDYGQVKLRQRGFQTGFFAYNVFSFGNLNKRSGIKIDLGVSFIQHWIRLQDDYNTIAQFNDPYDKGYDRLTNGVALDEFIGFQYMSNNRRINFYAGFSFTQAWTQNRRDYDFASMSSLQEKRLDLMSGFKFGWILPVFLESQPEEIFY